MKIVFISVLDLLKVGIGPSSSHTMGPMVAAADFITRCRSLIGNDNSTLCYYIRCTLKGSLAFTGKGHGSDRAIIFGLHGYLPAQLAQGDVEPLGAQLQGKTSVSVASGREIRFTPDQHIIFDRGPPLPQHPNGMIFELIDQHGQCVLTETYFSIGGGFINTLAEIDSLQAPLRYRPETRSPYGFDSAKSMLAMADQSGMSIAQMKRANELAHISVEQLHEGLDKIWQAMQRCIENGLREEGILPGGLNLERRAKNLYQQLQQYPGNAEPNDWLCAYAMAVNEENAAGHMVVTAPTNGAAGVIPAVLYHEIIHRQANNEQVHEFLLTAAAIGGIIKHNSSISGAEVGCQGEVGSAAAMAAAGLCAIRGGTVRQVENAAEIALEHHLGMTCDPVGGLVQIPCIERNGFGAIKAYAAASLALHGTGKHFMPLDNCIAAMKQTGMEMSDKFKETALGGLAVSITEC